MYLKRLSVPETIGFRYRVWYTRKLFDCFWRTLGSLTTEVSQFVGTRIGHCNLEWQSRWYFYTTSTGLLHAQLQWRDGTPTLTCCKLSCSVNRRTSKLTSFSMLRMEATLNRRKMGQAELLQQRLSCMTDLVHGLTWHAWLWLTVHTAHVISADACISPALVGLVLLLIVQWSLWWRQDVLHHVQLRNVAIIEKRLQECFGVLLSQSSLVVLRTDWPDENRTARSLISKKHWNAWS